MDNLKEKRVLWAEKALNAQDYDAASRIYTEVADDFLLMDKHSAAFFYILAARYKKNNPEHKQALYQKALKAYKLVNEQESIANLFLEIGHCLLENNEYNKAFDYLCNGANAQIELMKQSMENVHSDTFEKTKNDIALYWEDLNQIFKLIDKCNLN